jgi:hypothetical protein
MIKPLVLSLAVAAAAGCESTMPYAWVASEVRVSPSVLVAGEPVELSVTATNWGDETVYASNGCAPGLGFMITRPDQQHVNPFPATWPCTPDDSQVLEPGETDTVVFRWTPQLTGAYVVVGGLVVDDRLWSLSETASFEVRSE